MVKSQRLEFDIDAPWEITIHAYDAKMYKVPDPEFPDVLKMEFNDFRWDEENDITKLTRRATLRLPIPNFILRVFTEENVMYAHFDETVDRKNRRVVTLMNNENLTDLVKVVETTTFMPHPDDPDNKTQMICECSMNIESNQWGVGKVEQIAVKTYVRGIKKARIKDWVHIEKLIAEVKEKDIPLSSLLSQSEVEAREYEEARRNQANASSGDELDNGADELNEDSDDEFFDAEESSEKQSGRGSNSPRASPVPTTTTSKGNEAQSPSTSLSTAVTTSSAATTTTTTTTPPSNRKSGDDSPVVDFEAPGVSTGAGKEKPAVIPAQQQQPMKKVIASTDASGGESCGDEETEETMMEGERSGKTKRSRAARFRGMMFSAASITTSKAGQAARVVGRKAVVAGKMTGKAVGGAAVVAKRQTVKSVKAVTKKTGRKRSSATDAYAVAVSKPYSWRDANVSEKNREVACLARKMELERNSDPNDNEAKKELAEIESALQKITESKLQLESPKKNSSLSSENLTRDGFLQEYIKRISLTYSDATKLEVETAITSLRQLADDFEENLLPLAKQTEQLTLTSSLENIAEQDDTADEDAVDDTDAEASAAAEEEVKEEVQEEVKEKDDNEENKEPEGEEDGHETSDSFLLVNQAGESVEISETTQSSSSDS